MREQSGRMAVCAVTAALGVVLMLLGAALGLGVYIAPMLVGWCLIPIGRAYGVRYQTMLWVVISLLSAVFVADIEENMVFAFLFGWYPIIRPRLQKLSGAVRLCVKLALFNAVIIALETVLITLLVPEVMETWAAVLLLVLGNATFLIYDFVFPAFEVLFERYLGRFLFKRKR